MEKSQAQVRKEVYEYLEKQGFHISEDRHKALKELLKYVTEVPVEIPAQAPQEHHIKCPDCGGEKVYRGKKWRQKYNEQEFPKKLSKANI
ncbi:hypothetical protein LCGC14_1351060 [marine sediment metagenome]|uniref:Uncharacterized protein n=1 Tax=marine sediment metagenome TaxID=412755 RepID=A0A0F9KBL5_9ZZZZ